MSALWIKLVESKVFFGMIKTTVEFDLIQHQTRLEESNNVGLRLVLPSQMMLGSVLLYQHHFTSLHFTSLHFTSLHFTSLHFTSLHFTSLHFTSLHFTSLHFTFRAKRNLFNSTSSQSVQCHLDFYFSTLKGLRCFLKH